MSTDTDKVLKNWTLADSMVAMRNAKNDPETLFAKAGITLSFGDDFSPIHRRIAMDFLKSKFTDLCTAGPPVSLIPANLKDLDKASDDIKARAREIRKRVIAVSLDKGKPMERTTSDLVSALNAKDDPHFRADLDCVLDLMRTPEDKGGYGDLIHSSGEKRGAAYCVTRDAATLFGFDYADDGLIAKDRSKPAAKSKRANAGHGVSI